ncbi:hypothetical protein HPB49_011693 [Dermacentor silvarum]|uniref:Uncharacterized protein n=1 Tax=Dermacentor silvarum TaxID=543639 RepID=A0ACB8C902_DERSI|nr:hypothetical protein HPB49_011693 [Dermacentor silvarum]
MGFLWILSLHCCGFVLLLPLIFSTRMRELYFVCFFRLATIVWADAFAKTRRAALKPLESLVSHDPVLKKRGALRVLEIGAGLGGNLQYVRRDIVYTNVDPNQEFGPIFLEEVKKNPKVELERWVQGYGENMNDLSSDYFDVVMFTYLLCSVKNGRDVLDEVKRVLVKVVHSSWNRCVVEVDHPSGIRAYLAPLRNMTNHVTPKSFNQ